MLRRAFLVGSVMAVMACTEQASVPTFFPDENPPQLSAWGQLDWRKGALHPSEGVTAYELNAPLFTDYAAKLRTVWTVGGDMVADDGGAVQFPVGTVITKTFYYGGAGSKLHEISGVDQTSIALDDHRLIETRLLVRRTDGLHPISYIWNEDQTDAQLKRTGAVVPLELTRDGETTSFAYIVPNENQCAACHASDTRTEAVHPLGPTLQQLDRGTQLADWREAGLLAEGQMPKQRQAPWNSAEETLDARARSYLAGNCAHCHNPFGPADTSGLDLTLEASGPAVGVCKPPIAAGSGTGGHRFGITPGEAEASILSYRMASSDPGSMMPELGRSLVHEEGLALIDAWIDAMPGDCS